RNDTAGTRTRTIHQRRMHREEARRERRRRQRSGRRERIGEQGRAEEGRACRSCRIARATIAGELEQTQRIAERLRRREGLAKGQVQDGRNPLLRAERGAERREHIDGLEAERVGQATDHARRVAMAELLVAADAVVVLVAVFADEIDRGIVAGFPTDRPAARRRALAVDALVDRAAGKNLWTRIGILLI